MLIQLNSLQLVSSEGYLKKNKISLKIRKNKFKFNMDNFSCKLFRSIQTRKTNEPYIFMSKVVGENVSIFF